MGLLAPNNPVKLYNAKVWTPVLKTFLRQAVGFSQACKATNLLSTELISIRDFLAVQFITLFRERDHIFVTSFLLFETVTTYSVMLFILMAVPDKA